MQEVMVRWLCGDWSDDGHGKTDDEFLIVAAENTDEAIKYLQKEFEADCKKKFKLDIAHWFEDYEDNKLDEKTIQKLFDLGITKVDDDDIHNKTEWYPDDFFEVWLKLVKLCRPDIKIKTTKIPTIVPNGGYGLWLCD